MNNITIERGINAFRREIYSFYLENSEHLWLDNYIIQERQTTRHKFVTVAGYHRLEPRNSNISEADIYLGEDVIREAKDTIYLNLQVKKWSERG